MKPEIESNDITIMGRVFECQIVFI